MEKYRLRRFEVESRYTDYYSGEKLVWTRDGEYLFCQKSNAINIISVFNGKKVRCINFSDSCLYAVDNLITFDVSGENMLITAHKSGLLKLWDLNNFMQIRNWKSNHMGLILTIRFSPCNKIVCSTAADFTIRVWDIKNYCSVYVIKEQGIISAKLFFPNVTSKTLYAVGDDNSIRSWNYSSRKKINTFKGHISHITDIAFDKQHMKLMASVSVDKVLILWNILECARLKVIPLYESLHGVVFLARNELCLPGVICLKEDLQAVVIVTGITGNIYVINCCDYKLIYSDRIACSCNVTHLMTCEGTRQVAVVTSDHSISFYDLSTLKCLKKLVGYTDEILDICFLGDENQYLAIATNSSTINIYEILTMNSVAATGHLSEILTLSALKSYLFSAGKDMMVFVWKLDNGSFSIGCIGKYKGHSSAIGSICASNYYLPMFASGSRDGCLKLWISSKLNSKGPTYKFYIKNSIKAHDKEVNCVTFSPNNTIVATSSQDRNIKLWKSKSLMLIATLRGHRRGVRTVRFSPTNQILISSSNDCSIRIWSLSTLECLSKIEENTTILRLEFLNSGKLFVSASSDGIIKIWHVKSAESFLTLDEHKDRIWALAVAEDGSGFYSGGYYSGLIYWKDKTENVTDKGVAEKIALSGRSEILNNLLKKNNFGKAFPLALVLKKSIIILKIIKQFMKHRTTNFANSSYLSKDELYILRAHMRTWNTNSRFCKVSQFIVNIVVNELILKRSEIPTHKFLVKYINQYTQRHYKRTSCYVKELSFIDFVVNSI